MLGTCSLLSIPIEATPPCVSKQTEENRVKSASKDDTKSNVGGTKRVRRTKWSKANDVERQTNYSLIEDIEN